MSPESSPRSSPVQSPGFVKAHTRQASHVQAQSIRVHAPSNEAETMAILGLCVFIQNVFERSKLSMPRQTNYTHDVTTSGFLKYFSLHKFKDAL